MFDYSTNFKKQGKVKVSTRNLKKISEIICMSNTIDKPFQVIGITNMNTEVAISTVWRTPKASNGACKLYVSVKKEYCEIISGIKTGNLASFKLMAIDFFKELRWDQNIKKNTEYFKS